MLSAAHRDNLVRWTPDLDGGHYESHFLKVNLVDDQAALWWKFTVTQPLAGLGPARFEVWAIYFDIADPANSCAARETFTAGQATIQRDRLRCQYGDNVLEHASSSGAITSETDGHSFTWNLSWAAADASFRHFPMPGMYDGAFPKAKTLSPAINTLFAGTATVNGRTFDLADKRGMQGHNWGVKHADSWVWTHCNQFREDSGAVFEAVSSRIKVGPLTSPQLTILHFDDGAGEPLTINGWVNMVAATSDLRGLYWRFRGSDGVRGVEGFFSAPPERFVGINYKDPDGRKTHCLNSKVADGEIHLLRKEDGIWRLTRSLTVTAAAALEIGLKDETRGVRIHIE